MITPDQVSQLHDHLTSASSILILLGQDPKPDHILTAAALTQTLQTMGKAVELGCPDEVKLSELGVVGEVECRQKLGNQNLSISFDYDETTVDKVSYHIDEDQRKFFLIVKPQKGYAPLKAESVTFDYTGADADLVFLVGVHQFEALEHLYEGFEDLFTRATVVTIHTFEPQIGSVKLNVSGASSMSEGVAPVLMQLSPELPVDAATNLLTGIEQATDHFQSLSATAQTFEMVAELMKRGARRVRTARPAFAQAEEVVRPLVPEQPLPPERGRQTEVVLRQERPEKPAGTAVSSSQSFSQALTQKKGKKQKQDPKRKSPRPALAELSADEPQPGDLDYQPTGFGPGGTG